MTEPNMLSKEDFIDFILKGPEDSANSACKAPTESALPEGFEGFDGSETQPPLAQPGSSFARRLLEASGFGYAEMVQRDKVIRSSDAVARYLPERVSFWPETTTRSYQTLLFEADLTHKQLLAIPAFKARRMNHLDIVEDALARLVSEALEGFQRGGEDVTADVRKGRKEETLCVVSILDEREGQPVRLVCFGTQNKSTDGLETFQITEQTRNWDPQLSKEHLGLLYERQFKKLEGQDWQEAFTTTEERKQADKLLAVCTRKAPKEHDIQESVLDLLDTIAKGFGLRKKPKTERRLQAFELPSDHDIGIDPEERESSFGGKNPFGGVTLRDERSRLLGYIVYPLKSKSDATRLRKHLEKNNRFHNVLVVYPDEDQASLELWQGQAQLTGKLRKGQGYKDAADVVNLLSRFFVVSKAKVKNPTELAQELAYRAQYLRRLAVMQLDDEPEKGPLRNLYNAFKEALVHNQTEDEFADAFAQTITYGLLTARWTGNDELMASGERLTRQTALKYLPAASPFLTDLFKSALSVKLDEQRGRLLWLVDDIADLLDRIDVTYVFGMGDKDSDTATDPVIHFYEPFLAAYDKDLKNKRGVFFTPRPVVSYIVRSVHELLQKEFGLEDGLASTDTWGDVAKSIKGLKIPEGVKASDPFVCILDPATGTGTFLFECIEVIERTMKDRWCRELKRKSWEDPAIAKLWDEYVRRSLLPRLVGFELMMASYAIAHLKLSFKLTQTGYRLAASDRLHTYLTNSLDPPSSAANPKLASLFETLGKEAHAVNVVKRNWRFTVFIGNPPYSRASANKSDYLDTLLEPYKAPVRDERNIQPLSDDYIKFIRLGQDVLARSGVGVFGMITNNTFLSGRIHRGMRKCLLDSFPMVRAVNLHGSGNVNFLGAAGATDENVFDIQQGVSITLLTTHAAAPEVVYGEAIGPRRLKYEQLTQGAVVCSPVAPCEPYYLFFPRSDEGEDDYKTYPSMTDLFSFQSVSGKPGDDNLLVSFSQDDVIPKLKAFRKSLGASGATKLTEAGRNLAARAPNRPFSSAAVIEYAYRPFDVRYTYYDAAIWTRAVNRLYECIDGEPVLLTTKIVKDATFSHAFVSRLFADVIFLSATSSVNCYSFPSQPPSDTLDFGSKSGGRNHGNLKLSLFEQNLGAAVSKDEALGYIYAVLYSPEYRRRYREPLQLDFPRIPIARVKPLFDDLSRLGRELVALHLMEFKPLKRNLPEYFREGGTREIEKIAYGKETIWLDKKKTFGFRGVSNEVWEFRVGGYQVCEKWLKVRKGLPLSDSDVAHYQKMIVAVAETVRIMPEIDKLVANHGGWPGAFAAKPGGGKK